MSMMAKRKPVQPNYLGVLIKKWRLLEDLSLRDAAKRIGIGSATILRLEAGHAFDVATWMKIQTWLLTPCATPKPGATEKPG